MRAAKNKPVVLVVEDYADSRAMLKLLLEDLNHQVLTAVDGKQAMAIAANNRIDLILTDFGLPDMSGLGLVRRLRALNGHMENIPVIMLTAFDGDALPYLALNSNRSTM
jgi:CheY-like chemotaxis protein